ncbi:glutamine synthetase family protein [Yinghuangia sp. ASG 101]|uniref:glutamine synthetase family protein n=1 Tax=Yinghuangia sp. ASG 101 TaxID=2896848 RepID=UPI001E5A21C1|nr:glutamine synthetase family protein [Yinghuangia sp. ASG 101]UGQ12022.1 glutamine synthetase family protein [Yinghuangia sp. ASG 101]
MDTVYTMTAEHTTLARSLSERGVKYALAAWIDVLGRAKSKVVPVDHLPNLIAGSERYTPRGMGGLGRMNPVEDESVGLPDPSTLKILPWDRRVAWMVADLRQGGTTPFALCPRSVLKRQVAVAESMGFVAQLGVEPEFYVFKPESLSGDRLIPMALSEEIQPSPAYDVQSALDSMPFLDRVADYMRELDFGLFSFDAEGGEGQYEFDFAHAPLVETADRMTLFRLLVRQAAAECGLLATFMPKPTAELWGSGAHFNMSLEDQDGENLFRTDGTGPESWSKLAYQFTAGVLEHAPALTALANPTTNSYRRLVDSLADGQVSWAPTKISYGFNNRSCMLRLPANRPAIENRAVDSAANTYLVAAFMLAAGLDGIRRGLDPGDARDDIAYMAGIPTLPRTLADAVEAFEQDPLTHEVFHDDFIRDYSEMKRSEWLRDHLEVTDSERRAYLLNL